MGYSRQSPRENEGSGTTKSSEIFSWNLTDILRLIFSDSVTRMRPDKTKRKFYMLFEIVQQLTKWCVISGEKGILVIEINILYSIMDLRMCFNVIYMV